MRCYKIPSPSVSVISLICIVLSVSQALCSRCSNYFRGWRGRAFFFQPLQLRFREGTWSSGWGLAAEEGFRGAAMKHQAQGVDRWGVRGSDALDFQSGGACLQNLLLHSLSREQLSMTSSTIWPWASLTISSYVKSSLQSTYLKGLFWRLNDLIYIKPFE